MKKSKGYMRGGKTKGMAAGGKLKMVEKDGKQVPFFAADTRTYLRVELPSVPVTKTWL